MFSYSAYISKNQEKHSISNALFINEYELNQIGTQTLELLENVQLSELHNELSWLVQAISEYSDLQGGRILSNDIWMKQGYCYFEAIHTLRESILAGINSYFHISIGGLRSTLELILLHTYWESTKNGETEMSDFGEWIEGRVSKLPFKRMITNLKNNYFINPESDLINKIEKTYGKLCSYAHTPILKESLTQIKHTNLPFVNEEILRYWLTLLTETLNCLLHLLIVCYPISLFPVNLVIKFGFSPPVGLFFDNINSRPLIRCLGLTKFNNYQEWYMNIDNNIKNLLDWYEERPDLTLKQIKHSWNKDERHRPEYKRLKSVASVNDNELELLLFLMKLKVRTIQLQFIYKNL